MSPIKAILQTDNSSEWKWAQLQGLLDETSESAKYEDAVCNVFIDDEQEMFVPMFYYAIKFNQEDIVRFILDGVALHIDGGISSLINRFSPYNHNTLVGQAAANGDLEVLKRLVELGADVKIGSRAGSTAYKIAKSYESHEVTAYFEAKGETMEYLPGSMMTKFRHTDNGSFYFPDLAEDADLYIRFDDGRVIHVPSCNSLSVDCLGRGADGSGPADGDPV